MSTSGTSSSAFGFTALGGAVDGAPDFDGADGLIVVSYPTGSLTATGGTITTDGGNTVHTFSTPGSYDFVVTTVDLTLTASLFTNTQTFFAATVSNGTAPTQNIAPSLFTNTQTFYAATLTQAGPQTLIMPLVTNTQTFFGATVSGAVFQRLFRERTRDYQYSDSDDIMFRRRWR